MMTIVHFNLHKINNSNKAYRSNSHIDFSFIARQNRWNLQVNAKIGYQDSWGIIWLNRDENHIKWRAHKSLENEKLQNNAEQSFSLWITRFHVGLVQFHNNFFCETLKKLPVLGLTSNCKPLSSFALSLRVWGTGVLDCAKMHQL